jgi:hypothetical protein
MLWLCECKVLVHAQVHAHASVINFIDFRVVKANRKSDASL